MKIITTLITLISLALIALTPIYAFEALILLLWAGLGDISFKEFHHAIWSQDLSVCAPIASVILLAFLVIRYYLLIPLQKQRTEDIGIQDPDSESHW